MSKFAVIKIKNDQYLIEEGNTYEINHYESEPNDKLTFNEVLLKVDGDSVEVGKPLVEGATVEVEVVEHKKGVKVVKKTYKAKSRQRKTRGHRQSLTVIKILKIK